jgi:hypothetical protein
VRRISLQSDDLGVARNLTITSASVSDCDFQDITVTGPTVTGTRLGNRLGNTNISFPATKTVYWNLAGDQTWDATAWASTDGGIPALINFPLAQDNVIINSTSAVTSISGSTDWSVNTVTFGPITPPFTFAQDLEIFGNFTLVSGITCTGSTFAFAGRNTQTFTTAGLDLNLSYIDMVSIGGTVNLVGNLLCSSGGSQLNTTAGTFNANGYNATVSVLLDITTTSVASRGINLGSGNWTFIGDDGFFGVVYIIDATNFTLTTGAGAIYCNSASTKTFEGGGLTWPEVINSGAGQLIILSSVTFTMTFAKLSNSVSPTSFQFLSGMTLTLNQFNVSGTPGNLVTLTSTTPGSPFTLSQAGGVVNGRYLNITDSTATGGAQWYAGTTSIDGGGNTGWQFVDVGSNLMFFF